MHREKPFVLLNEFVGAALAAKNTTDSRSFAAKAAPTKTGLIQYEFFSVHLCVLRGENAFSNFTYTLK